ncbi:MAG: hypothetical protein H6719_14410 [Sandaracinaceae bacterium]|nr:hypothetical protein [Sandaracinaceae bacterium]
MSDHELDGDPEAKALQPKTSKRTLVIATFVGGLLGLAMAIASLMFDRYIPRVGLESLPDAGPAEVPDIVDLDAGPGDDTSPWLDE